MVAMTHPRIAEYFPPLGVRITAGPLELRGVGEDELVALIDIVLAGEVHDPAQMPFSYPWTDAPAADAPRNYLQFHWGNRAAWTREAWDLELAVLWEGRVVGCQGVITRDFPTTRTGETGSWIARPHQGRGIGTRSRQAICAFLFDHLDFDTIASAAFLDNAASLRVSEKVGYVPNGTQRFARRGAAADSQRLLLTRDAFVRGEPIRVEGADALRRFIGLDAPQTPGASAG